LSLLVTSTAGAESFLQRSRLRRASERTGWFQKRPTEIVENPIDLASECRKWLPCLARDGGIVGRTSRQVFGFSCRDQFSMEVLTLSVARELVVADRPPVDFVQ